jgi:hypothetical protein
MRDWPFGPSNLTTVFTNFFDARVGNPDLRLQDFLRQIFDEMYTIQHIGGNPTLTKIWHVVMERIRAPLPSTILPSNLTGSSILLNVQRRTRELLFGNSASARNLFLIDILHGYLTTDRVCLSDSMYIGGQGLIHLSDLLPELFVSLEIHLFNISNNLLSTPPLAVTLLVIETR